MSLDRLIKLAHRTGDRLIVHQPTGEDIVIMDIDAYESMLEHLEMIDTLQEQLDDFFEEDEATDQPVYDDLEPSDAGQWDHVGALLGGWEPAKESDEERIQRERDEIEQVTTLDHDPEDEDLMPLEPEDDEVPLPREEGAGEAQAAHDGHGEMLPRDHQSSPPGDWVLHQEGQSEQDLASEEEPRVEELPREIPLSTHDTQVQAEEEPLEGDEPVFYEEPV